MVFLFAEIEIVSISRQAMGFTAKQMAFAVGALGLVSFILGIMAENKKVKIFKKIIIIYKCIF